MEHGTIYWIDHNLQKAALKEAAESFTPEHWDRARDYVDGYVEVVKVLFNGEGAYMLVNEEGLLHGLPFNMRATSIYHCASIMRGNIPREVIVGRAVLLANLPLE